MRFVILSENRKNGICSNEDGLSIYFDIDGNKFLFDSGSSDLFIRNAKLLNINLDDIDTIVLSHGHWDHGNGLKYLNGKKIILHPDVFVDRYSVSRNMQFAGINQKLEEMLERFEVIQTKSPYMFFKDVYYLGQIPRTIDFEGNGNISTVLDSKTEAKDYTLDDSGVVIKTKSGIVVVSGCAHSGICNTIENPKKVAKEDTIIAVIGGFHLRKIDDVLMKTIGYFEENNVQNIFMGHCSTDEVIKEFEKTNIKVQKLYSGAEFEIDNIPAKE